MASKQATALTISLDPEEKARLDAIATETGRSAAQIAYEALHAYLDVREWQTREIEEAVAKADAGGPFIAHADVRRRIEERRRKG